jgi:transcriptional regulator with XRE-family HTH domain
MELQSIRKTLKLSRLDLALYLDISIHTVKAIELHKREVPLDRLTEKADLIKGILDDKVRLQAAAHVAPATTQQMQKIKHLQNTYRRRLNTYTTKLEKMQENYAAASTGLVVVQQLAESLAITDARDNRVRRKWTKTKITELTYILKANNQTAQEMLTLEIAGLQMRIARLEGLLADTPATSR